MHRAVRRLIHLCNHQQSRFRGCRGLSASESSFFHLSVLVQFLFPSHKGLWLIRCYCEGREKENGSTFYGIDAFGDRKDANELEVPLIECKVNPRKEIRAYSPGGELKGCSYGGELRSCSYGPESRRCLHDGDVKGCSHGFELKGRAHGEEIKRCSDGSLTPVAYLSGGAQAEIHNVAFDDILHHPISLACEAQLEKVLDSDAVHGNQKMADITHPQDGVMCEAKLERMLNANAVNGIDQMSDILHPQENLLTCETKLRQMPNTNAIDRIDHMPDIIHPRDHRFMHESQHGQMPSSVALHEIEQRPDSDASPLVDASLISFILNEHGWSPKTEKMVQRFSGLITPELANNIICELKNAKAAMGFLEWAGNQENYKHQEGTFTKVIGRLGKDMDFAAAWNVLEFMRQHGLHVDYAFSIFIHRLKSAKMVDGVVKAIDSMKQLDVIPTVPLYTSALQLILKDNRLEEARRIYKKMRELGLKPDVKLYGLLISGFGRAGKIEDALFIFKEMQGHGVFPDTVTYVGLVRAFAIAGNFEGGKSICVEMIRNNCLPKVLSRLELGCALHGMTSTEQIERFLQDIETKGHVVSVFTYNNMLQYLLDKQMLSEAIKIFGRFSGYAHVSNGNLPDGPRPNIESYSLIIRALCQNGRSKEAVHFYKEMLLSGLKADTEICDFLLHYLSNAGLLYDAVELSKYIIKQKLVISIETQRMFFKSLHDAGDLSNALKIFDSMKWRGCITQKSNFHEVIGIRC